jgi:hypothetical protein
MAQFLAPLCSSYNEPMISVARTPLRQIYFSGGSRKPPIDEPRKKPPVKEPPRRKDRPPIQPPPQRRDHPPVEDPPDAPGTNRPPIREPERRT